MASKRGQRRKQRRREKQPPPPPPSPWRHEGPEDFDRARAAGQMIEIRSSETSLVEQQRRNEELSTERNGIRARFPRIKAEILAALAPFDAFDLLAALQISFARDWPKGKGPLLQGMPAAIELLALLLVERGPQPPCLPPGDEGEMVGAFEKFMLFAEELLGLIPDFIAPPPVPADKSADAALSRIQNRMIGSRLILPLFETDGQADSNLLDLFGHEQVRTHFRREIGLDAEMVLRLTETVGKMTVGGFEQAVTEDPPRRGWLGYGEALSFTVAELADEAGSTVEQARIYVDRFSLALDGTPFEPEELTTRARWKPLLRDDDRLIPISIAVLRRSLRTSLTALLNPRLPAAGPGDKKAFSIYTAERGAWLERKAVATLDQALRPAWSERNVYFELPDGRRGEIDGVIKVGEALLPVQAKAGATRIDTEATDPERLRETLISLLGGENLRQHREAVEALSNPAAKLSLDPAGIEPFRRDLSSIRLILPVHVTLDDLSAVGAQPWLLAEAGLSEDRDLPWIIGLGHLELLLLYFEIPALFLHFLTRRSRANLTGQLIAQDEIDWALRYGEDQLLWAELPEDDPYVDREFFVLEEHDAFDRWILARETGGRSKRPRPSISTSLRNLLRAIDRSRPREWLGFSLALLDLPDEMRTEVVKLWQEQKRSDRRRQAPPLDIGFGPDGEVVKGFTVLREEREMEPEARRLLREYCLQRLSDTGAIAWSGIVAPFTEQGPVRWCCHVEADRIRP